MERGSPKFGHCIYLESHFYLKVDIILKSSTEQEGLCKWLEEQI